MESENWNHQKVESYKHNGPNLEMISWQPKGSSTLQHLTWDMYPYENL